MAVYQIPEELVFPDPEHSDPDGLLGIGGDLSAERLLLAYENGIFPWFAEGEPILWWSPDPRCVLFPKKLKITKSLQQVLNKKLFDVRYNTCFEDVIVNCSTAKGRETEGTWILPQTVDAYCKLHRLGYASSVEVFQNNKLVGGLYGVHIGKVFCGESMFHTVSNASKVALCYLSDILMKSDFKIIDCQIPNDFLLAMGAENIPRFEFLKILKNKEI